MTKLVVKFRVVFVAVFFLRRTDRIRAKCESFGVHVKLTTKLKYLPIASSHRHHRQYDETNLSICILIEPMKIDPKLYDQIAREIHSDTSPVGIDAKKTHILILQMLMEISERLDRLENRYNDS